MNSVLVTGASSGIGRAVAEEMLAAGWRVGLLARRRDVLETVAASRDTALVLEADVTDEAAVEAAFNRFSAWAGRIDLLFNNAGAFGPQAEIDKVSLAEWQAVVGVNLTGMFLCARAAFARMKAQEPKGGRIVNNGSISADRPRPGSVCYTATKHGVTGLTKTLSLDGRPHDIACGQIDIGNARTDLLDGLVKRAEAAGEPPPPTMDVADAARTVRLMAEMPLDTNVQFVTVMATKMPYIGRG
ncbi:SDR family oxidoreductase [Thalassococcus sp. CAU 1522]|uniref:SDR family oxidoreductase n=1 Tax=Thalassococcus arenae TaxID=2851652 RepID=A0ABS6N8C9_9RHOB|nr:SDR family oxidoreductase [Thalassococcus arenae]MBV2360265.1 SDR family oxidoreductase [Thalassococcus arenae]